jgi:ORF6N domain
MDRFPEDFMFQLSVGEAESLRSQIVISNLGSGGRRYLPGAFTEHGVVMPSSVLRSRRAVQMNIFVVRAFVRLREMIAGNKDLAARIEKLERGHERAISVIEVLVEDFDLLEGEVKRMKAVPPKPRRRIGF